MTAPVVMVVEDDVDIRATIVEIMDDAGLPAIGAENGAEALELLARLDPTPRLIFLDLMMPVMDGAGFRAEQVKHPEWAAIPVVLMSAYRDVAERAAELDVEYVTKPIGMDPLLALARKYCA